MENVIRKIIISGANGFLGSNLLKSYLFDNVFVYAMVRDIKKVDKQLVNNKKIKFIELDMKNISDLTKIIKDSNIDIFYYFSWEGSSGVLRGDYNIQINNIKNVCDTIHVAKALNCKKFVFAESIMEYEIQKAMSNRGNVSINTIYSTSKLCAEYMLKTIAQNIGIEYVGALISNIYGEGEKSARLINTTIRKLINKEYCSFSSGEQLYDFIYISDAIEMFKIIAMYGMSNISYYVGNKKPKKLKEFLIILRNIVDKDAVLGFGEYPDPTTIINYNEFDTSRIYNDFNFKTKVSFEEGIKRTYKSILEEL